MAEPVDLWPHGVASKSDMKKFTVMMCGQGREVIDYSSRLPFLSADSFFFFVPGGCAEGTPLANLQPCVPELVAELQELHGRTSTKPEKAVVTGASTSTSFYLSGQLSRECCNCRINFGGEGRSKRGNPKELLPVDCQQLGTGRKYSKILQKGMAGNYIQDEGRPVYLEKHWHALLNDNDHAHGHRISAHSDASASYRWQDPITSLSWGASGVLVLSPAPKLGGRRSLVVTRGGDVSIMGGHFQEKYHHAVPPVEHWPGLLDTEMGQDLQQWEVDAMLTEIGLMRAKFPPDGTRPRQNSTIRWHHNHYSSCPQRSKGLTSGAAGTKVPPQGSSEVSEQSSVANIRQQFENVGPGVPQLIFKLGTGPISACPVRVSEAAVRDTPRSEAADSDTPEVREAPRSEAAVSKTPEARAADIKRHTGLCNLPKCWAACTTQ